MPPSRTVTKNATVVLMTLAVAACHGDRDNDDRVDWIPPTVSILSHTDGQVVTGSRNITLSWTANDDAGVAGSTLVLNGAAAAVTGSDGHYDADVALADGVNTIIIEAADVHGNGASRKIHVVYPFLDFTSGQAASVVIGQADFHSWHLNQGEAFAGPNTIAEPYGNAAAHNGTLFLPDTVNNRILGFGAIPTTANASATFALGQPDLTTTARGTSSDGTKADRLYGPKTVVISDERLFAVDSRNNRVLIWNDVPAGSAAPANVVVGQPDAVAFAAACTATGLAVPEGMHAVTGKLIVADSGNNRVLIWNSVPSTNGQAADLVLGQPDFSSCAANRGNAVAGNTLSYPSSVWSDGAKLVVADAENNRVLVWNAFPATNGQAADVVLGQPDLSTSHRVAASEKDFNWPYFVHSNGNQLFLADSSNNRVLIWDALPATNYSAANRVLGQVNFANSGFSAGAANLDHPSGVFAADDKLIVTDGGNNRYLIFQVP